MKGRDVPDRFDLLVLPAATVDTLHGRTAPDAEDDAACLTNRQNRLNVPMVFALDSPRAKGGSRHGSIQNDFSRAGRGAGRRSGVRPGTARAANADAAIFA